jgi:hypothetical protein
MLIWMETTRQLERVKSKDPRTCGERLLCGEVPSFLYFHTCEKILICIIAQTVPEPVLNSATSLPHTPGRKATTHRLPSIRIPGSVRSQTSSHPQPLPLHDLLLTLPPVHIAFFTYLDKQLDKIDTFYAEREKEAQARNHALEIQLRELKDHRKIFYVSRA